MCVFPSASCESKSWGSNMHCHNGYYVTRETHFTTFQYCMFMMGWVASLACTVGQCSLFIECVSKKS